MRGTAKINPWNIIRAQHETYVDVNSGRGRVRDYILFDGLPILVFAFCLWRDVRLSAGASNALLTASGLLAALLFGVMLQISDRAMGWADSSPEPSKATTDHARFLRELAANSGYASLVCIAAAIAYVIASTTGHAKLEVASAFGLALGSHVALVLLMVMKRVFALTEERLTRARTGADRTVVPHKRRKTG